jgi:hypothetical protein
MKDPTLSNEKYPSEEQGAFDPVPTHPEPNSPAHTVRHPEEKRKDDEVPEDEDPDKFDRSSN